MAAGLFLFLGGGYFGGIVSRVSIPYTGANGASHEAVEQGFHDQNPGADHGGANSRCRHESDKLAL
jgi:hypothetical protein